jgi:hypothetical protein
MCPHCVMNFVLTAAMSVPFLGAIIVWFKTRRSKKCSCKEKNENSI